jgi:HD-GYP domain-containing protein (c-di-GMP phosphodiesterase class II)
VLDVFLHSSALMNSRLPSLVSAVAAGALVARERKAHRSLERFGAAALQTLLNAIEANDHQTGMHVRRVAVYAVIIAEFAGLDERCQKAIERVALFHDIGKIHEALFDIVHEERRLSHAERLEIHTHPERGAEVLRPLGVFYPELPPGVAAHHERWDGSGYPHRLRGTKIPIEARVVAIADTFDAVAHARRYRRGTGAPSALRVIEEGRGTQFDPELVDLVMLPPVADRLAREHAMQHVPHGRRHRVERERIPDISFRWRSESLASHAVAASSDL